jgi:hypothetical protein
MQNNESSQSKIPTTYKIIIKTEKILRRSVQAAGGLVNITVLLLLVSGITLLTYSDTKKGF